MVWDCPGQHSGNGIQYVYASVSCGRDAAFIYYGKLCGRALFYRKQRADAIAFGNVSSGRITGVTRQDVPYTVGEHNRIRYQRYYFLQVEVTDPVTGVSHQLESQGYRKPVHRYLSSDCVKVYTDQSGWKHYIEGFQWKEHKSDPDIFPTPKEYEEMHFGSGVVFQIIFVIILLLMIYNVFGRFM